ncbi:MAG: hypothetical protein DRO93_04560 [Candidatus Thorarchaeota archaeon]|nr:MAG: hypothetical protein DRO93_04560 [Candidatus Thorarchaeota archaeon]
MALTNLLDTEMSAEPTHDLLGESQLGFQRGVSLFYLGTWATSRSSPGIEIINLPMTKTISPSFEREAVASPRLCGGPCV